MTIIRTWIAQGIRPQGFQNFLCGGIRGYFVKDSREGQNSSVLNYNIAFGVYFALKLITKRAAFLYPIIDFKNFEK